MIMPMPKAHAACNQRVETSWGAAAALVLFCHLEALYPAGPARAAAVVNGSKALKIEMLSEEPQLAKGASVPKVGHSEDERPLLGVDPSSTGSIPKVRKELKPSQNEKVR